ncbi:MAG: ribosome-associated translation inhibitor RaiA [Chlamydiales bacterium]|nr:ribosome-associated translation inhibitor RaiA [Chlamydiia bacterium]MCP5503658.1 ribosome-associated translation inhibitor RaiA [Chlamydiales bacterium]
MTKSSQKFDDQEYTISVVGKNIEITKPIRDYIEEKIGKIEALSTDIIDVKVRLDVQKLNHMVDIFLKFSHFRVNVRAITENMYSAIDKSFEKLYTKLRKWKSRIQDHHGKGVAVTEMEVNILEHAQHEIEEINQEIIDANNNNLKKDYALPKVIKKKRRPLKTLTIDEAVMKMELSDDNFKVYRSEEDQALKVIYRRRDGSYGVISPE